MSTIGEFAALRFDARAPVGPDGDIVDAVAAGVNFRATCVERRLIVPWSRVLRALS